MSFPRYASYKDSGVEWLGDVPSQWKVERLKLSIESCRNGIWGQEADGGPDDITCVRVADFDRVRLGVELEEPTIRSVSERERGGRLLRTGDLLLEKSGGGEKQPVGAVVLYGQPEPAVCSNFVARMRLAPAMNPRFWTYVHSAAYAVRLTDRSINQTSGIQNLDQAAYLEERAPYPSTGEQAAIADFLDRETAKIDALVEAQRRLIALLKEKRQAVISHAVTKDLDPSAPLKPSGIPWLGDVPGHWEVVALSRLVQSRRPITYGIVQPGPADPNGRYMIRGQDYSSGWVAPEEIFRVSSAVEEPYRRARVRSGDLVITIVGAGVGNVAVVPDELEGANLTQTTARIAPDFSIVNPSFLQLALTSNLARTQVAIYQKGAAQPGLNLEHLKAFRLLVPALSEQREIARRASEATASLVLLIAEAGRACVLLAERRAALISAAVTGKIDVRGLVAQPEAAEAA